MTISSIINKMCGVCLCYFMFMSSASAAEPAAFDKIRFITHSPFLLAVINEGKPPESYMNAAYLALFQHMNYTPRAELTVTSRFETILNGEEPVCTFMMIKNPAREARYRFSLPTDFLLAHRLYQTTSTPDIPASLLNEQGELKSLKALFSAYPKRKLMLLKDRSHGAFLDSEIASLPESTIYYRWGSHEYDSDIQMLVKGRGEYILAYPYDIRRESANHPEVTFRHTAIAGNSAIRTGHVMCNESPQTAQYINEVNKALRELYYAPEFRDAHLQFNDPSTHDALKRALRGLQQL